MNAPRYSDVLRGLADEMGSRHPDEAANVCRKSADLLDAAYHDLDALGVAIADAGYAWTPAMRTAYEHAHDAAHKAAQALVDELS